MKTAPQCSSCDATMAFDLDGDVTCINENCHEYGQPYTLTDVENRTQSKSERAFERELSR